MLAERLPARLGTAAAVLAALFVLHLDHQTSATAAPPPPPPLLPVPTAVPDVIDPEPPPSFAPDPWLYTDAMQGPYANLCLDRSPCALDVITEQGKSSFAEFTVLLDAHEARLVVRTGNDWWYRDLGPRDASIGAPHEDGDTLRVQVGKDTVTCGLASSGIPHCR